MDSKLTVAEYDALSRIAFKRSFGRLLDQLENVCLHHADDERDPQRAEWLQSLAKEIGQLSKLALAKGL